MFKRVSVVVVLAFVVTFADEILACGDKFLVPSRGMRFQAQPIDRESATVLLYAQAGSALGSTLTALSVEATLRKAGYRPTSVTTEAELARALGAGGWDVVILDLADGPRIAGRLPASAVPIVLPVAHDADRAVLADAKRQYPRVLQSPKKDQVFLEAVDKAIAARARARARAFTKTGD